MGIDVDIIEPCGFPFGDRGLRRAGMDYVDHVTITRHADWDAFLCKYGDSGRLVLLSSKGADRIDRFQFRPDDILLFGSETAGVPESVHERADARITIPMQNGMRSLNVAVSVGMTLAISLSQTGQFPA